MRGALAASEQHSFALSAWWTMTWDHLYSTLGAIATTLIALLGVLQRPRLSRWYRNRRSLIEELGRWQERAVAAEHDNARLTESLESTIKAATFSREELDSLVTRIETIAKNQAESDAYIRGAIPYMAATDALLLKHGLTLPPGVAKPPIPPHLQIGWPG
jgi:hypothetical protein